MPEKGLIAITGKSGCGKSTLLNMLIGIESPSSGEIYFGNKNLAKLSTNKRKIYQNKMIGILFQHFNLFPELSSLDNVILPALIAGKNRQDAVRIAETLFSRYKIEYLLKQKYETLSGGEKQRVALLRALINDPPVILADEPTGALDSKNSQLLMDELYELSKSKLVIIVTHNLELIEKYPIINITIKEGAVNCPLESKKVDSNIQYKSTKAKTIANIFMKLHLKQHIGRNFFVVFAIAFSSICLMMSIGYQNGSQNSLESYQEKSLIYPMATIAKKTVVDVPNSPIKISHLTRPTEEEIIDGLADCKDAIIANNYQYVFPAYPTFEFDGKSYDDFEFSPVYDFSLFASLLISGNLPKESFNEVVVNEEFIQKFNYKTDEIINRKFNYSFISKVHANGYEGQVFTDEIVFSQSVKIVGVVREFAYLNSPRVYYCYNALENLMATSKLINYSLYLGQSFTIYDLVTSAVPTDAVSSYNYYIFMPTLSSVKQLYSLKEKYDASNEYDITSNSYLVNDSYKQMTSVVGTSLIAFLVLVFIGSIFIVIITAYANFMHHKKESAILSVLGAKGQDIFSIFSRENVFVTLLGIFIGVIFSIPISFLANDIIYNNFRLDNLIAINYFSFPVFLLIIVGVFLTIISTYIPFKIYERGNINMELKDE